MLFSAFIDLLVLILIANGSPVVARRLLRGRFSQAMDFGASLADGYRLLGESKTWRGLFTSLAFTSLCALIMGYHMQVGLMIALFSMLGDLVSSFIKRRLGKPSKSKFLFLDQVPESLFPALMMVNEFNLAMPEILYLVIIFILAELILSKLMYYLGVRQKPY
jgi:CDP-2,3-bis-(O-geranylgeranyl)-sn-glycerol synthase